MRRTLLTCFSILLTSSLLFAEQVTVQSPSVAHTYAFSSKIEHRLRLVPPSNSLAASVVYSNVNYVTDVEPREDEEFDFVFPGVKFDRRAGLFYLPGAAGGRLGVAEIKKDLVGHEIKLLPTAHVRTLKRHGTVTASLIASSSPLPGPSWQ